MKAPSAPVVTIEHITPEKAEKYLATMVKNRPVSGAKELEYGIAMEQGKWSLNAETIKFNAHGQLFDGQHRLRGCILAGKPFQSAVARGIDDPDAFSTVDVGKNRSHADIFSIAGFGNAGDSSAVASIIYLHETGKIDWRGPIESRVARAASPIAQKLKKMPNATAIVPKDQLLAFAEPRSEGISSAVRFAHQSKAQKLLSTALLGAGYYLFRDKSFNDAEQFFHDLGEGTGLTKTDAVYHLRERLIDNKSADAKINRWTVLGLMFKAWNKRRENEPLRFLRVNDGEQFPKKLL